MTNHPDAESTDSPGDETLSPTEATDADDLRNDDGDAVVTPPDTWQNAAEADEETLDDRLAAEEPEVAADNPPRGVDDDAEHRRHLGQVSGAPEDGESFFTVEE